MILNRILYGEVSEERDGKHRTVVKINDELGIDHPCRAVDVLPLPKQILQIRVHGAHNEVGHHRWPVSYATKPDSK